MITVSTFLVCVSDKFFFLFVIGVQFYLLTFSQQIKIVIY